MCKTCSTLVFVDTIHYRSCGHSSDYCYNYRDWKASKLYSRERDASDGWSDTKFREVQSQSGSGLGLSKEVLRFRAYGLNEWRGMAG